MLPTFQAEDELILRRSTASLNQKQAIALLNAAYLDRDRAEREAAEYILEKTKTHESS